MSRSWLHEQVPTSFAVEVVTCLQAVHLGLDMGRSETSIEGDSLEFIKKCKTNFPDKSLLRAYISDIKELCMGFKHIDFKFIPRSWNGLTHVIAKETLKRREEIYLEQRVSSYAKRLMAQARSREPD